ncbi:hypothetical protein O181_050574 [Austropuccinia psidii MF-1]|uniref:Retrovirus-related Pol polyprotein from transposon TNT 1-94-like beta-barrel domain-containing protein n=1 Tax=Austropuccinia psidii MF-1 TaxID=1389203 RepID=A0A9Q3DX06_9BASI|nr:hypothetical protein [Austropuccinia psidii MF-1]
MKGREDKKDSRSDSPQIFVAFSKGIAEDHAILDSGESSSLFKTSKRFFTYHPTNLPLFLADGSCVHAVVMGTAVIVSETGRIIHLKNSLVIPSISSSLIALLTFLKKQCTLIGRGSAADLVDLAGKIIFKGAFINNTVSVNLSKPGVRKVVLQDPLTINRLLGHPSNKYASKCFPSVHFSKLQCDLHLPSLDFNPPSSESLCVEPTVRELPNGSEQAGASQVDDSKSEGQF